MLHIRWLNPVLLRLVAGRRDKHPPGSSPDEAEEPRTTQSNPDSAVVGPASCTGIKWRESICSIQSLWGGFANYIKNSL